MPTITRKIELRLCTEGLSDQERKAQWRPLCVYLNINHMKKRCFLFVFLFSALLLSLMTACGNDDNDSVEEPKQEESANYYVKYQAHASSNFGIPNIRIDIVCTTGIPNNTFTSNNGWEETFGPFKKGENVSLQVSSSSEVIGRIYVSRNREPFALKVEKKGYYKVVLDYTIE